MRQSEGDLSRPEIKSSKDDRRDYVRAAMSYNLIQLYVNAGARDRRRSETAWKEEGRTGEKVSLSRDEKEGGEKKTREAEANSDVYFALRLNSLRERSYISDIIYDKLIRFTI